MTTHVETMKLERRYVERCAMFQASLNVSKWSGHGMLSPDTSASRGLQRQQQRADHRVERDDREEGEERVGEDAFARDWSFATPRGEAVDARP